MSSLINYLLYSSIFYCYIINLNQVNGQKKKIDPQKEYYDAILNYKIFQSLKCNGTFDYKVFVEVDQVCNDCKNLLNQPEVVIKCRNICFLNVFFHGCMEMLFLNDTKDIENIEAKRLTLNDPSIQGPINLPEKPAKPEPEEKSIWRKIYENLVFW